MTKALQDAFDAAARLSEQQQDALAAAILEDLDGLGHLADEALADHVAGRTLPLDPEKL